MLIDSTNSCVLAVYNHVFTSDIHRLKHLNADETLSGEADVYDYSVPLEAGFQLATFQGPLCAEPVEGIAYFVESLEIDKELYNNETRTCLHVAKSQR